MWSEWKVDSIRRRRRIGRRLQEERNTVDTGREEREWK